MPVVAAVFAWITTLVTSSFTAFAAWMIGKMVYEKAVQYALITAFLVAAASLTLAISLSIKATIFALRVALPPDLALVTYFLPSNINGIVAALVTIRVSMALYRWTVATLSAYVPSKYMGGKYAY